MRSPAIGDRCRIRFVRPSAALWSRPMPMVSGSLACCLRSSLPAADRSLSLRRVKRQRRGLSTGSARIFVLDGLFPGAADAVLGAGAIPCLASLAEVEEWSAHARRIGARLATALHVDSGLNRLGLPAAEVAKLVSRPDLLASLDVVLVMSHLASADDPADPTNAAQHRTPSRN